MTKKNKLENHHKLEQEDNDLNFLTNLLIDIHNKYYSENIKDVRDILEEKKNVFKGLKFYIKDNEIGSLIEMYGGKLVKNIKKCDFYLEKKYFNKDKEEGDGAYIPVIHIRFIYDSIYKLEMMPINKYVIGKIAIENEESEDSIESILNDIEEDLL
ncbi:BRCT [Nosema bombycis CQ1]|uniref:BRCT n=1 Tax=Nosema bombycis (strain CQ1 / CVCC 102059) TaxID=578461 RepID=R0KT87_NOSB1|nr:BRCT [Nosema bombycis CQ1]|eukprot:EOB14016.1 BRCT [Nosema bombycis CQ1]